MGSPWCLAVLSGQGPNAALGRDAEGVGLDGDSACQAIIDVAMDGAIVGPG
jgi:hypothetical protein